MDESCAHCSVALGQCTARHRGSLAPVAAHAKERQHSRKRMPSGGKEAVYQVTFHRLALLYGMARGEGGRGRIQ